MIRILFAPFIYCQSLYSFAPLLCLPAYIPRPNALQCSQVGQRLPSPQALCLCVLSALLCCQTRRLVIQSGWRGSRSPDKASAEGASSPRRSVCWQRLAPCLSTHTTFASLPLFFSFLSLSLCTLPQTHPISYFLSPLSELHTYFLPPFCSRFSFCSQHGYLQHMLWQILLLSSIRGWRYKWMFSSLYLLLVQSIISVLYSDIQKT